MTIKEFPMLRTTISELEKRHPLAICVTLFRGQIKRAGISSRVQNTFSFPIKLFYLRQ